MVFPTPTPPLIIFCAVYLVFVVAGTGLVEIRTSIIGPLDGTTASWIVAAAFFVCSLYFLRPQLAYLRRAHPRIFVAQMMLVAGITILPTLAAVIGDAAGAANFHDARNMNTTGIFWFLLGFFDLATFLTLLGLTLFFAFRTSKAVKVLGIIGHVCLWMLVAAASWFAYGISYSAHDPSTE